MNRESIYRPRRRNLNGRLTAYGWRLTSKSSACGWWPIGYG